jgi:hypothetical protein
MVMRAYLLAIVAVLPLLAAEVWSGFRVGFSDDVLGAIAATEQPLSVRSPGGPWAMLLALTWFGLAYWRRDVTLWEAALVVLGGAAALARLGNAWIDAAAMVLPLGRQVGVVGIRPMLLIVGATLSVGVAALTLVSTRPPVLDSAAAQAAQASASQGTVLSDWRWAGDLQRHMGSRQVLASGGLASESSEFWVDYLRIAQGHERWAEILQRMNVDLVVLEAADQQHAAAELVRGSPDWQVSYDTRGSLVAQRARP